MTDLRDQLLEYGRQHRAEQQPVTPDEIRWADRAFTPEGGDMTELMTGRPRVWLALAAAAVVVVLVGLIAWFAGNSPDVIDSTPDPTGETLPAVPVDQEFSIDDAVAITEAYFPLRAGFDAAEVRALFTDDAQFDGDPVDERLSVTELIAVWDEAQGTIFTEMTCEGEPSSMSVICTYGIQSGLAQAVGAPPVPSRLALWFNADGLIYLAEDEPDFSAFAAFNDGFDAWMQANHPQDAEDPGSRWGETIEEARAFGERRVGYAELYAAYLLENGCVYDEPCVAEALNPVVVFDGEACLYQGPTEFVGTTVVRFQFTNFSDAVASLSVWRVPEGTTAADIEDLGLAFQDVPGFDLVNVVFDVFPDNEVVLVAAVEPGHHVLNCFVLNAGGPDLNLPVFFEVVES